MNLSEWAIVYVKHKDLVARKLQDHKVDGEKILFTFSDRVLTAYAMEKLSVPKIQGKTFIFALQTKENIELLLKHWKEFSEQKELTMIFVNPQKNEKWLVNPHTHESISEGNVELGIRTMAGEVSFV